MCVCVCIFFFLHVGCGTQGLVPNSSHWFSMSFHCHMFWDSPKFLIESVKQGTFFKKWAQRQRLPTRLERERETWLFSSQPKVRAGCCSQRGPAARKYRQHRKDCRDQCQLKSLVLILTSLTILGFEPGMVVQPCNASSWESEAGRLTGVRN